MSAKPTLWIMEYSPPACAVRTIGEYVGVQFNIIKLDYDKQEHKAPEFLKINPVGAVPLLKDGDFFLSDSHAILKYVLARYGSPEQKESLYPSELRTRALVDQALFFDTGAYFNRFRDGYFSLRGNSTQTALTPKQKAEMDDAYAVIENYIGDKQFVVSDHLTLADISLGVTTAALQTMHKLDRAKFPRTSAWFDRLNRLPFFENNTKNVFERLAKSLKK